jgi:hypothetical protein
VILPSGAGILITIPETITESINCRTNLMHKMILSCKFNHSGITLWKLLLMSTRHQEHLPGGFRDMPPGECGIQTVILKKKKDIQRTNPQCFKETT